MCVYLLAPVANNGSLIGVDKLWDTMLAWFNMHTNYGIVIMGRKMWNFLKQKPLPNRRHIIVSRKYHQDDSVEWCTTLKEALDIAGYCPVYIIGGKELFHTALLYNMVDACILTHVDMDIDSGVVLPTRRKTIWTSSKMEHNGLSFHFELSLLSKN
tara:strand:- start:3033 stop:3500 length:468 start_codon:yes stop_codon:yes gene_type:complete